MEVSYKRTRVSCYTGYVTQAIVNSLLPLLFVTFQKEFGISLAQIAALISINFGLQFFVDIFCMRFVDKIGYRASSMMALAFAAVGLAGVGIFPTVFPDAYAGLVVAVLLNAFGGGIIEVVISPIVESLPSDKKAAQMSFLHSFYCWGCVMVILFSTLYFNTLGMQNWRYLPLIWAIVPILGILLFSKAPMLKLVEDHERIPIKKLFGRKLFVLMLVLMVCSGAAEQAMTQWASLFAELGLQVSKTMGDLLGPCAFSILMGISRVWFGLKGEKLNVERSLFWSALLCIGCYLLTVFSPIPMLSLIGCMVCGFSVGLMWPGTLSLTAKRFPTGGTAMFALLALGGDLGCASGPGLVGAVSDAAQNGFFSAMQNWFPGTDLTETSLKSGLFFAMLFAVVMAVGIALLLRNKKRKKLSTR